MTQCQSSRSFFSRHRTYPQADNSYPQAVLGRQCRTLCYRIQRKLRASVGFYGQVKSHLGFVLVYKIQGGSRRSITPERE